MSVSCVNNSGGIWRVIGPVMLAGCVAACSLPDFTQFRLPRIDSNTLGLGEFDNVARKQTVVSRPISPEDLVDAQGRCGSAAPAVDNSLEPVLSSEPRLPKGVALRMTECEVVRALGPTRQMEIVPSPDGERNVVMTYTVGERAGIYRFKAGRLVEIERGAEPPPPPEKKPAPKKPARKPTNA